MSRLEAARLSLVARIDRLTRWEFWPAWAVYLPLSPYLAWLALRHRGLTTCALANPGIPLGGFVGESKWNILRLLPRESVVDSAMINAAPPAVRLIAIDAVIARQGWSWPIVLKPDVGERGAGVALIRTRDDAQRYLDQHPERIIAQAHHPGPFEAGVFYIRHPDEPHGRLFSITEKRFAAAIGDGGSTLRTLILRHPRFRLQSSVHLSRLGADADRIPRPGEVVQLGFAGNHCRGTMFLDGARLITPQLSHVIDSIARRIPGFHFGRFDIRCTSERDFTAGLNLKIVELNGLSSESTNIYDPAMPFWRAQSILRAQWRWAFRIGAANRAAGHTPPTLREIGKAILRRKLTPRGAGSSRPSRTAASG